MNAFKRSVYKFMLVDDMGEPIRKFATKQEATPYLTEGMRLIALPKQPDLTKQILASLGDSPF